MTPVWKIFTDFQNSLKCLLQNLFQYKMICVGHNTFDMQHAESKIRNIAVDQTIWSQMTFSMLESQSWVELIYYASTLESTQTEAYYRVMFRRHKTVLRTVRYWTESPYSIASLPSQQSRPRHDIHANVKRLIRGPVWSKAIVKPVSVQKPNKQRATFCFKQ